MKNLTSVIGLVIIAIGFSVVAEDALAQIASVRAATAANDRIVGGGPVDQGDGRWAVRLNVMRDGQEFICGGSLVEPRLAEGEITWQPNLSKARWVITAAHCIDDADKMQKLPKESIEVVTGRVDLKLSDEDAGETRSVVAVIPHPEFDRDTLEHDIALLVLDETDKSISSAKRSSIRLPDAGDAHWIADDYLALVAQGWGRLAEQGVTSQLLQEVRVPQVRRAYCAAKFDIYGVHLSPGMICAGFTSGGFDSCAGDSGGPLVFRPNSMTTPSMNVSQEVLVGVVSWGIGCARQDLYGIYTSTAYYRGWLDAAAEECLLKPTLDACNES